MKSFAQVPLDTEKLAQGLAAFSDNEVPWTAVAVVKGEPSDIARRWGIAFYDSFDNLDTVKVAVLAMASGMRAALIRHCGSPTPGTDVCLPERALGSCDTYLSEVMDALDLRADDVVWSRLG